MYVCVCVSLCVCLCGWPYVEELLHHEELGRGVLRLAHAGLGQQLTRPRGAGLGQALRERETQEQRGAGEERLDQSANTQRVCERDQRGG